MQMNTAKTENTYTLIFIKHHIGFNFESRETYQVEQKFIAKF